MEEERVPFVDGMSEGQGFNTYLQDRCMHDAVRITRQPRHEQQADSVKLTYDYSATKAYTQILSSLEISAGAGLSKMGIGGEIDTKFINRTNYETSILTYVITVNVEKQAPARPQYHFNWVSPQEPTQKYGNRFINGFIEGGAFYARVSIETKDLTIHNEITESAKAGFPMYGVDIKISQAMRKSTDKICKESNVTISTHTVGAPPGYSPDVVVNEEDNALIQLKKQADKFIGDAEKHNWKRYAILEKYTNISDFKDQFIPLDYRDAEQRSWSVLDEFTKYFVVGDTIRGIQEDHFTGTSGRVIKQKLLARESDMLQSYRTWVTKVSRDPEVAKEPPKTQHPDEFLKEVLHAVKWTTYVAQSIKVPRSGRTHIVYEKLKAGAQQLFAFQGLSFPDVLGTAKLTFGRQQGQDKYVCFIGREMAKGYDTLSECWVFEETVRGLTDVIVNVYVYPEGVVELEQPNVNDTGPLFTFHVRVS